MHGAVLAATQVARWGAATAELEPRAGWGSGARFAPPHAPACFKASFMPLLCAEKRRELPAAAARQGGSAPRSRGRGGGPVSEFGEYLVIEWLLIDY